jgi:lysozyme
VPRALLAPLLLVALLTSACGADPEPDEPRGSTAENTASAEPSPEQTPSKTTSSPAAPEPTPRARPVRGVDVSHHQGEVDWVRVRRDRIGFAYLKATEGSSFTDPRFLAGARAARSAGLRVGGYHYFSLCSPGAPQAAHFARVLDSAPARSMPPAIDLELLGNCAEPPPRPELLDQVRAFIDTVERRTGQQVVVYAYPDFEARYGFAAALDRRQWVRRIGSTPPTREWFIWQKDDQAVIDGITGPADLNLLAP